MRQLKLFKKTREPPLTESEAERLHHRLLEESLRMLGDNRAGDDVREDVMQWVDEKGVRPFSFDACCIAAGVNPEKTRDAVHRLVERLKKKEVTE